MFDFLALAETWIATLDRLGDFLLSKPAGWASSVSHFLEITEGLGLGGAAAGFLRPFLIPLFGTLGQLSYGQLLFGFGLVGLLTYKFIKFILDIVL